jgi:DNA-binding CsgD family transcriptional regulator
MLAVAQNPRDPWRAGGRLDVHGIYLGRLCCAAAASLLERGKNDARRYLLDAMRLALPHGFITPFAESVTALGGLTEQCLGREFPALSEAVMNQWERTFQNWTGFHNQFTKDNLTLVLTRRENHVAQMVARRVPYAKIAKQQCVSQGRLRNIMQDIYQKTLCLRPERAGKVRF